MKLRIKMGTMAIALIIAAALVWPGTQAARAESKHVGIGVLGTTFLDISYHALLLAGPLGYWDKEGFKVDVFPVNGVPDAAQLLASGQESFVQLGSVNIT